ncbi:hypothetical protein [Chryseobacterium nematophagum]|uniref:hypothetical protein n=1 Tax=Chryseobacterium nematophagum TaxID=2305228 RepID=UPI0016053688|nr:hypothetical protein [Chryseobacterium nematophagum]
MIIDIKVEHVSFVNLCTEVQREIIRIGLIDHTGQMEKTELEYKTENGKVKMV